MGWQPASHLEEADENSQIKQDQEAFLIGHISSNIFLGLTDSSDGRMN